MNNTKIYLADDQGSAAGLYSICWVLSEVCARKLIEIDLAVELFNLGTKNFSFQRFAKKSLKSRVILRNLELCKKTRDRHLDAFNALKMFNNHSNFFLVCRNHLLRGWYCIWKKSESFYAIKFWVKNNKK